MNPEHTSAPTTATGEVATALWYTAPGRVELRRETLAPTPTPDHARVITRYSGISHGTEALIHQGRVPESEHERMRAPFQAGDFPFPVKYGYASVGEVAALSDPDEATAGRHDPAAAPAVTVGSRVFCLFPHQDRFDVPLDALRIVPETVPSRRAVLGANLETALNVAWDLLPRPGERIAVLGAGVVGLLTAWLLDAIPGTDVTLVDPNPGRAEAAAALGIAGFRSDVPGWMAGQTATLDALVDASGHPEALVGVLEMLGVEGRLIEASWFGDRSVPMALGGAFHSRRLRIVSSQVGRIPADMAPRWDYARRMQTVMRLLADPRLDALLEAELDFDTLPECLPAALAGARLCIPIAYPAQSCSQQPA